MCHWVTTKYVRAKMGVAWGRSISRGYIFVVKQSAHVQCLTTPTSYIQYLIIIILLLLSGLSHV